MKKTYMQPATQVVKIDAEVVVCASPFNGNLNPNGQNGSNALAKEREIMMIQAAEAAEEELW